MATKIRLQRHGKKGKPFYHVVVADSRSPRDGKFIERVGSYNPNTNPATVEIDFEKTLDWMNKGAQPTDTCRTLLSHQGVLYMKHLQGGVKKGALTQEQADAKFNEWKQSKEGQVQTTRQVIIETKQSKRQEALAAEAKVKEERAAAIAARNTPPVEEAPAEEAAAEENTNEEPAAEETAQSAE